MCFGGSFGPFVAGWRTTGSLVDCLSSAIESRSAFDDGGWSADPMRCCGVRIKVIQCVKVNPCGKDYPARVTDYDVRGVFSVVRHFSTLGLIRNRKTVRHNKGEDKTHLKFVSPRKGLTCIIVHSLALTGIDFSKIYQTYREWGNRERISHLLNHNRYIH